MLPRDLSELARKRIEIEYKTRTERFEREAAVLIERQRQAGGLYSSGMIDRIAEALAVECQTRAMIAWEVLARVVAAKPLNVEEGLAADLKGAVAEYLGSGCDDLRRHQERAIGFVSGGVMPSLESLRARALEKVNSEIDISLLSTCRSQVQGSAATTVNIYQPFGIVQTGPGSIATFAQTFGPEERKAFLSALTTVEGVTASSTDLSSEFRSQIEEVVREVRAEVEKPSPNPIRLRGAFAGLATAIQTLGSLKPAYDALKAAAAFLGIHLP